MEDIYMASTGIEQGIPLATSKPEKVEAGLTNLNTVTQNIFSGVAENLLSSKVILRCDVLPQVAAPEQDMITLFQHVVNMILCCPLPDSKLFLYIKSGYALTNDNDVILQKNLVQVNICTNSITSAKWQEDHSDALEECITICKQNNGAFIYNIANQTSPLFTINLPGKLNTTTLG
jgi:hypothetical protein